MFFTIYKITNKLDGKIYIGKHQTKDLDDGYMGSGKVLKRAIQKHGKENFTKEILFVFNTEVEMNAKEAELVDESFCLREDTYNLCSGGQGGFGYINKNGLTPVNDRSTRHIERCVKGGKASLVRMRELMQTDPAWVSKKADAVRKANELRDIPFSFGGRSHSQDTKTKMSVARKKFFENKENNPMFGKMWITDGTRQAAINKQEPIPYGWSRGKLKKKTEQK